MNAKEVQHSAKVFGKVTEAKQDMDARVLASDLAAASVDASEFDSYEFEDCCCYFGIDGREAR